MNEISEMETGQHLTFKLGKEVFALDVFRVREILDLTQITEIPGTPDFLRGVINVRGGVVPVVDLRRKFGMRETEGEVYSRIVVMEPEVDGETAVFGALAESVHDVIALESEQIEDPPKIGTRWRTEFIKGIGKLDDQFVILLDIDRVFSSDELGFEEIDKRAVGRSEPG